MKWKFFNTPLGLFQPYGVSIKSATGSSGSGGAAAASVFDNFVGGMFGMAVNDMNNAMNHRIAEETNEANKEINEQQIAFAREQYEKEKAENRYLVDQAYQRSSPMAQKARYLAAGLNPYLSMSGSGGSAGAAGVSVGSPAKGSQPQAIPMQTGAPMQSFNPLPNGFGILDMSDYQLRSERQSADIAAQKADLQIKTFEAVSKALERNWNSQYLKAKRDQVLQDIQYGEKSMQARLDALEHTNNLIMADIRYKDSMTALNQQAETLNIRADNRAWIALRGQLALWSAQAYEANMSGYAHQEQGVLNGLNAAEQEKRLKFIDDIYKNNKEQADQILLQLKYKTGVQGWRDFTSMLSGFIPFAGVKYNE